MLEEPTSAEKVSTPPRSRSCDRTSREPSSSTITPIKPAQQQENTPATTMEAIAHTSTKTTVIAPIAKPVLTVRVLENTSMMTTKGSSSRATSPVKQNNHAMAPKHHQSRSRSGSISSLSQMNTNNQKQTIRMVGNVVPSPPLTSTHANNNTHASMSSISLPSSRSSSTQSSRAASPAPSTPTLSGFTIRTIDQAPQAVQRVGLRV